MLRLYVLYIFADRDMIFTRIYDIMLNSFVQYPLWPIQYIPCPIAQGESSVVGVSAIAAPFRLAGQYLYMFPISLKIYIFFSKKSCYFLGLRPL